MPSTTILVGTASGLYQCGIDRQGIDREPLLAGREIRCIQRRGGRLWALVDREEIWSRPRDEDWSRVGEIPGGLALSLLPQETRLLVGTSDLRVHIYGIGDSRPLGSGDFQDIEGRRDWYSPGQPSPEVRSLAGDAGGTVYANVHVGGILRWKERPEDAIPTIDFHQDVHQVHYDQDRKLLLAATAEGLAWSADQGDTWRTATEGLHASYLRAVTMAGDTVLVTASTGPGSSKGAVYRSVLAKEGALEGLLEKCREGLPEWLPGNINTYCIDGCGQEAAFGSPDGTVYASTNRGVSWTEIADSLPAIKSVALAS